MKNESNLFMLTEQRLNGYISGFPVIVSIYTGKSGTFDIEFSVHKTTGIYAGTDRTEILALDFDWRRYMISNIKTEVEKFLRQMKETGDIIPS